MDEERQRRRRRGERKWDEDGWRQTDLERKPDQNSTRAPLLKIRQKEASSADNTTRTQSRHTQDGPARGRADTHTRSQRITPSSWLVLSPLLVSPPHSVFTNQLSIFVIPPASTVDGPFLVNNGIDVASPSQIATRDVCLSLLVFVFAEVSVYDAVL